MSGIPDIWFLNAEDPAEGYNDLSELLDDTNADFVEVQHATVIQKSWHVRLWDDENGDEWHRFDNEDDAKAYLKEYRTAQGWNS